MRHVIEVLFLFLVVQDSSWAYCNSRICHISTDEEIRSHNPNQYYAKIWPSWKIRTTDKYCLFRGYKPAGGVRSIGEIKAPIAELEAATLLTMAGKYGAFATASTGAQSDEVIIRLGDAEKFKKVTKTLTKLSSNMGLLGVIFSVFSIFTEDTSSAQHIIDATNEALDKLTYDVNRKFESMQKYVDQSQLDTLKTLAGRQYKSMFQGWSNCVKEPSTLAPSDSPQMECQRSAYRNNQKKFPLIAVFANQLKNGRMDRKQTRQVEVHLEVFRNYAQLIFMQLTSLIQTHREERVNEVLTDEERTRSRKLHEYYVSQIRYWKDTFTDYAEKSVEKIKEMHNENVCAKTLTCRNAKPLFVKYLHHKHHYADEVECSCTFNENAKEKCSFTNQIWKQRQTNGYTYCIKNSDRNTCQYLNTYGTMHFNHVPSDVNEWFMKKNMEYLNNNYIKENMKVVTAYWDKQLINIIPTWKAVSDANDVHKYCAVKNTMATMHTTLNTAQRVLGVSVGSASQAIIPMTLSGAGDPLTLKQAWNGGSMSWIGITDINRMRAACVEALHPCDRPDGGGCEQKCDKKNTQEAHCSCGVGFTLNTDQKSCDKDSPVETSASIVPGATTTFTVCVCASRCITDSDGTWCYLKDGLLAPWNNCGAKLSSSGDKYWSTSMCQGKDAAIDSLARDVVKELESLMDIKNTEKIEK